MNFFKNIFQKKKNLLQLELYTSAQTSFKIILQNPDNDFDVMYACIIFYATVLKTIIPGKKLQLSDFFSQLKPDDLKSRLEATLADMNLKPSKLILKLFVSESGKKEIRISKQDNLYLTAYVLIFFYFTLENISRVYRPGLVAAFLTVGTICMKNNLSTEEIHNLSWQVLHCLYTDAT